MAIRLRKTGELVCAAKSLEMEGDTYINDTLHYELAQIQKVLVPNRNESENGLWHWLHGWCNTSDHPEDVRHGTLIRTEK